MRTVIYIILAYTIYAILKSFLGMGGLLGGAIAGAIIGLISWLVEKRFPKKEKEEAQIEKDKNV